MPEQVDLPQWLATVSGGVTLASLGLWIGVIQQAWHGKEPISYEPRRPVPWGKDGAFLALFCIGMALLSTYGVTEAKADRPAGVTLSDALAFGMLSLALALMVVLWQRNNVCARLKDFGLPQSGRQLGRDFLLGLGVFIAALIPVYMVQMILVSLFGLPTHHPTLEQLLADPTGEAMLAAGITAVIVAPLFEEFTFRVMLQGGLEKMAGASSEAGTPRAWWPVVMSSAAFALAHQGQGFAPVPLFVLALGLGYAYRQTHRLAPCVVAHAAFNAFSLMMAIGMGTDTGAGG